MLSLKSFRNSWFGRKFWPIHDIFTTFIKCSSGVGTPGEMKGMRLISARKKSCKITFYCKLLKAPEMVLSKSSNKRKRNINVHCTLACDVHSPPLVHVRVVMGGGGGLIPIFMGGWTFQKFDKEFLIILSSLGKSQTHALEFIKIRGSDATYNRLNYLNVKLDQCFLPNHEFWRDFKPDSFLFMVAIDYSYLFELTMKVEVN